MPCTAADGYRLAGNCRLANWVSMQRLYQKELDRGEPSTGMTTERAAQLSTLGFILECGAKIIADDVAWEAQLTRLAGYKAEHSDCNVPKRWA